MSNAITKLEQKSSFTIGELAKATDVHIETIRFYQRRGLMDEPQKPVGGIRRYGIDDVARIRFIKSAQNLGFSLDEIIILLALEEGADCATASKIAQKKLVEIKRKISDLRRIEKTLSELLGKCKENDGAVQCPIISSLQMRRHDDYR